MRIAIASGKGGTGKTTLATNLAVLLAGRGVAVRLLDGDVEEPDCHLFLHPETECREPVTVPVPVVDQARCTACGVCAEVCAFKAITLVGTTVLRSGPRGHLRDRPCRGRAGRTRPQTATTRLDAATTRVALSSQHAYHEHMLRTAEEEYGSPTD